MSIAIPSAANTEPYQQHVQPRTQEDTQARDQISITAKHFVSGNTPEVLTRIYDEPINMVAFTRSINSAISAYCQSLSAQMPDFKIRSVIDINRCQTTLNDLLPDFAHKQAFQDELTYLIDMYSCLFELDSVGLRLEVLNRAMCPRFHVDKLGCRLISTFQGVATQWLANQHVDRSKLGIPLNGLNDLEAGLYDNESQIQQVTTGDVVLLKGEGWYNNEGNGIVHRSPHVPTGEQRVVVTLDFA